jgi:flavin-dependent dehydrogenase
MKYDVAIVGGGLAGLCLAIQLADAHYKVILFEKEVYPFHKVCGEYISMESFPFLQRLGMPLAELNLPRIKQLKVSAPNGKFLEQALGLGGFGISRYTLDANLAEIAIKKGVQVKTLTKVNEVVFIQDFFDIKTTQGNFQATLVCGSYGKRAVLDQQLNRPRPSTKKNYIGVKYHIKLNFPNDLIELHNFKNGYCGISKVDGDKYCLCYLSDAQNLKEHGNDIKKMEVEVLMKNPFLKRYFNEATFLYKSPLTISQISFAKKSAVHQHVLMLGDAAGNIAPLCGNGMSMAMHASMLAFEMIALFLENKISRAQLEAYYAKIWHQHFEQRIKVGAFLQHTFGKEILTNLSIGILSKFPKMTNRLIEMTHGKPF